MKFVFEELPGRLVPFDEPAFFKNPAEFDVITTSRSSGNSIVFSKKELLEIGLNKALVASSSIPLLSRAVTIGGESYFDGGVSDSIPVEYALGMHEKAVVVLTRPRGYRKGKISNLLIYKMAFRKYPEFMKVLINRNEEYNQTLDLCERMEQDGRLFLLAPSAEFSISRTEPSLKKRMSLYLHGYRIIEKEFENLTKFLSEG